MKISSETADENDSLPKNYNETQISCILRNPAWLFVFWNISEADLKGALKNEQADKKKAGDKNSDNLSEEDKNDYQLIRALDLVKALYLYGQYDNTYVGILQKLNKEGKK